MIDINSFIDNNDLLGKYTQPEIDKIHRNQHVSINGVDMDISTFINMKHNGLYYLDLGKLNKQFTDRVKKDTGINIDGYTLSITSDGKNHFAKHMNRPEIKKITINDLNNLANILSNYDSAKAFSNHSGLNFEFITETNSNYKYITLELVSKGKNNLSLLDIYATPHSYNYNKKKGAYTVPNVNSSLGSTSVSQTGSAAYLAPNQNIANNTKKSNGNNQQIV